jgi:hypothetical protein
VIESKHHNIHKQRCKENNRSYLVAGLKKIQSSYNQVAVLKYQHISQIESKIIDELNITLFAPY